MFSFDSSTVICVVVIFYSFLEEGVQCQLSASKLHPGVPQKLQIRHTHQTRMIQLHMNLVCSALTLDGSKMQEMNHSYCQGNRQSEIYKDEIMEIAFAIIL